jgi:tRNA threonylcarbamoyladenosine biosynthesis protein TsaE
MNHITHNEEEMQKLAQDFAKDLVGGEVIFLHGNLGSGKTTFVRGATKSLGFNDHVRSPTFTIVNRYPINHKTIKEIVHVDLYRIEDPSEITQLALEEDLGREGIVSFIEWPEKANGQIISSTHELFFKISEDTHEVQIKNT